MEAEEYFERGLELAKNGNFKNAIDFYSKAININKEYCIAYVFRSNAYSAINNYQLALEDCNTSLILMKNNMNSSDKVASILLSRAEIYIKQDCYDKAIEDYRETIKLAHDTELIAIAKKQLAHAYTLRYKNYPNGTSKDLIIAYVLDNNIMGAEADKILKEKLNIPVELFENMSVEELIEAINTGYNEVLNKEYKFTQKIHNKATKGRKLDLS